MVGIILIICSTGNQDLQLARSWDITSKSWWKGVYSDGKYVISSPLRWEKEDEWNKCAVIMQATIGIMFQDEKIQNWVQERSTPACSAISSIVRPFGGHGAVIVLGGLYLSGCLTHNTKLKRVALLGAESAGINAIIVRVLKVLIGRSRPYREKGAWDYCPFNIKKSIHKASQSFPSGHTSSAFAIASCFADESENPLIATIWYLGATIVGLSRIHDDMHWASDVFLGSAIGISVGNTIAKLNKRREK